MLRAATRARLVALTVSLILVSLPHALEDFAYGDLQRLGITLPAGVAILLGAYALQTVGIALTARARAAGPWLLASMGAVWCIGAILIHGHDLLFAGAGYRHGFISKLLEVLIIVLGASAAGLGVRLARLSQ